MGIIQVRRLLACLVLGTITSVSAGLLFSSIQQRFWGQESRLLATPYPEPILNPSKLRYLQAITVKVQVGEFFGSGIIVASDQEKYHVLTNDHVLDSETEECEIKTADAQLYPCQIVARQSEFNGLDLALVRFSSAKIHYPTAVFSSVPIAGETIFAVGFSESTPATSVNNFVIEPGTIWRQLERSLQEGYQVGYSSQVIKGMSGGAVVNPNAEVVAINGMNAYPMLGQPYFYQDGSQPKQEQVAEMRAYSFGIPADKVPAWVFNLKVSPASLPVASSERSPKK
jgi:S1-C subfamily serine protease